jgi:membrane fusion protein, multidrug efflux system
MKTRTKFLLFLLPVIAVGVVVLKISLAGGAVDTRKQQTPVVKVEAPTRQTIVQSLRFTGDVLPIQQAQVFAKVYGALDNVYANIGDYVHTGQLLALVDTLVLAQQARESRANYINDSLQFVRAKSLQEQNLAAQQDFDNARTALEVARSNYESALTSLNYAKITAPFSGFITKRYLDPGAVLISTNATVLTLMDLDVMKIMVNVQEKDIPSVTVGTEAVAAVDAYPNKEFTGKVVRLSQALDLGTRTMAVEVDIPNSEHILKPGMFANVSLVIGKRENAITLPTQALQSDQAGSYVFIADSTVAHRVTVKTGIEQDSHTEILSGLQGDEKVITTGQQFARDGGPIRVSR